MKLSNQVILIFLYIKIWIWIIQILFRSSKKYIYIKTLFQWKNIFFFIKSFKWFISYISLKEKVQIYATMKDGLMLYTELDVEDSIIKFTTRGTLLIICGLNINPEKPKSYCLYFVDLVRFNTVHCFENLLSKVKKMKFIDEDKYLFCLLENSYIMGVYLNVFSQSRSNLEYYEENKNEKIYGKFFKLIFRHNRAGNSYNYFDYDPKLE